MRSIDIINRYTVQFHKVTWSPAELSAAKCLSMVIREDCITADTRIVCANSIHMFMTKYFPNIMLSRQNEAFREDLFSRLREMYKGNYNDFHSNFYSKAGYPRDLYKHQKNALSQMLPRQYNLLSFEQGLGKTISSATISKLLSIKRTIIVCPSLVKWNWYHDMTDSWGFNPIYWTILDSKKSKTITAFRERFVVINFEMIPKFLDYLTSSEVGHIIIDECQYIKNHRTRRYKGVEKLVKAFPKARVTLLSGTPITNRINDLFAYLKLTGHELGKSHKNFIDSYTIKTGTRGGRIIGSKNIGDLRFKLSNFMIRKKSEECLDLPDLVINKYYFKPDELSSEYDEMLEQLYQNKLKYDKAVDKEKQKLNFELKANLHTLNRIVSVSKAKQIKALIDKLWDSGRKAIVFAGYKDALSALEKMYGDKCVKIDGSVDSHKRQKLITKFKNDPNCHVFLGNFKAAGVGINLVNARDVIFMNFPFTPDDLEQPYKRAHRIGQNQKVNVYYTIAEGTIDERIFQMIVDKSGDINELIDKGKKGVVHYPKIEGMLWKQLIRDYEKKTGRITQESGMISVKN